RVEQLQFETVLLENPRPLSDIGNAAVPVVGRADCKLEHVRAMAGSRKQCGRRHEAECFYQVGHPNSLTSDRVLSSERDSVVSNSRKMQACGFAKCYRLCMR